MLGKREKKFREEKKRKEKGRRRREGEDPKNVPKTNFCCAYACIARCTILVLYLQQHHRQVVYGADVPRRGHELCS